MAQDTSQQQTTPTPVYKHYVVLSHDRRIIAHHSIDNHGPYNQANYQDLLDEHPGSTVEPHTSQPANYPGHVLSADGTTATRPTNDIPIETVTDRRNEVVDWGLEQLEYLQYLDGVGISIDYRYARSMFHGFIFNTILLSSNRANLRDSDKWGQMQKTLIDVADMYKRIDRTEFARLAGVQDRFYDDDHVYTWHSNGVRLVKSRTLVSNDPKPPDAEIPDYGLGSALYETRALMRIPHPAGVRNAGLGSLVIKDQDDNVIAITPTFSKGTHTYTATAAASVTAVTIEAPPEWEHAHVKIEGEFDLPKVTNDFRIHVVSEDKERDVTYVVKITKQTL